VVAADLPLDDLFPVDGHARSMSGPVDRPVNQSG
jgi:hypothetical protein